MKRNNKGSLCYKINIKNSMIRFLVISALEFLFIPLYSCRLFVIKLNIYKIHTEINKTTLTQIILVLKKVWVRCKINYAAVIDKNYKIAISFFIN